MTTLRSYQKRAVSETLQQLRSGTPTVLVAPTGAGKTVIAAAIAEHFKRVMVIAHRREILQQARETFGWHVHARSVQGFSSDRAEDFRPSKLDLLIIDEAHRSAADTYKRIINQYPGAARLGLTATPLRTDGRGLSDSFAALVECSSIRELMEAGYLTPYRALEAPDEALKELAWMHRRAGDYQIDELSALMSRPRLVGDVVREYVKHGSGRTAVAFAVTVEHSEKLAEAFKSAGVRAAHLDGHASDANRRRTLALLESGKLDVLCNVNLFTEGWDCPPVSCVIMARPTASLTLYLQSVGRGMRPSEGKQDLLILDHAGNMQRHGYPDVEREWSLEGPREKAEREAREMEAARLAALGFDSVEAELLERQRIEDSTLSAITVMRLLREAGAPITSKSHPAILRRSGIEVIGSSRAARYSKQGVDDLLTTLDSTYTTTEVRELLGLTQFVPSHFPSIKPVTQPFQSKRWLKSDIDALVAERRSAYSIDDCGRTLGIGNRKTIQRVLLGTGIASIGISNTDQRGAIYPKEKVDSYADRRAKECRSIENTYSTRDAMRLLGCSRSRQLQLQGLRAAVGKATNARYFKWEVDARIPTAEQNQAHNKPTEHD